MIPKSSTALHMLLGWLRNKLEPQTMAWLEERCANFKQDFDARAFYTAFSLVSRKCGHDALDLCEDDIQSAMNIVAGWSPQYWDLDVAARAAILLTQAGESLDHFDEIVNKLFLSADLKECQALYRCLPLLPHPKNWLQRAGEGLRTNMKDLFESVAHHNPYPHQHFPDEVWNQMVLKALFIQSPLWPIQGLAERCNDNLTRMLMDYSDERKAAGRPIPVELWSVARRSHDVRVSDYLDQLKDSPKAGEREVANLASRGDLDRQPPGWWQEISGAA